MNGRPRHYSTFLAFAGGRHPFVRSAALTAALMFFAGTSHAQTNLYWGGGNTTISNGTALPVVTTGTGFNGTWDTTTKNWSNNATSTVYQAWNSSVTDVSLGLVTAGGAGGVGQTITLANGSNFTFTGRMYGGIFGGGYNQIFEFKPVSGNATVTLGGGSTNTVVFDFAQSVNNQTRQMQFDTGVSLAGSANLTVRGGSIIDVRSDSSAYTGAVRVEHGVLKIDNYSGPTANMRGATSFDIHNVNLGLGEMSSASTSGALTELILNYNSGLNAIGSTANITLSDGAMQFIGIRSATTPTVQNAGSLTLNTYGYLDLSAVNGTAGSGLDAQLNFQSGLIRNSGNATSARDTLLVGVNTTGTLAGNTAAVTFAGGSATYGNNLLPWASTTRAEFLKINASNVLEVVGSTQAATDLSAWAGNYTSASDIRVGNNTAFTPTNSITNTTVNSLGLYTSGTAPTLTIASGNTLTIASGGLAYASAGTTTITGGSITTSSNNPLYFSVSGGGILLNSVITGNIDVVKSGTAGLTLNAPSNNTYTGTTYVNGGSLILNTGYVAIPGALVINNGGSVLFKVAGQIASNSAITINEGGFFNVNNAQILTTSGLITINNGQLYESNGNGVNANGGLAFNGGFVTTSAGNAGTITLGGNVSYASSSTTAAVFQQVGGTYGGSAINTTLSLGNATRTFNIADSSTLAATTPEMTVGFNITSTGSSGQLVKTGDGVLRLTGGPGYNISNSTSTGQNTYSGGTVINAGTLNVGYASNVGVTANGTAAGAPNNTALVFFAAPVNLILGQKLNGSDSFVASILSPTEVLMSYNGGATMTNALSGNLTSFTFDATVAQSGRLLGTGTVTINGGASGDTPALLADSGVTTANAITVGTTGTSRTIGSSSTSGTATYTGNITLNGGVTLSAAAGGTVAFNTGTISGAGNVTKSGAGTVTLSGTNTFTGATTVSGGTLEAAAANALGSTSGIMINTGGTLLVSANASIGSTTTITMNSTATGNGTAAALKFSSSYNGTVGALTLDANSIFDLGTDPTGVRVHFSSISGLGTYTLAIYNWTGTTLWEGGTGNNLDQIYAGNALSQSELQHISFYSSLDTSSFRGTGYQIMSGSFINELGPVPEPATWVAMSALIFTGGIMGLRRRR